MDPELLHKALKASQSGKRYAFATVIEATLKGTPQKSGAKMMVTEDGASYGTIGGGRYEKDAQAECLKAIKSGKAHTKTYEYFGHVGQSICGGRIKVFIEPAAAKKDFILCGGGHIALALAAVVKMLNFRLTVIDNRRSFANKKRFPFADRILVGGYGKHLAKLKYGPNTYVMIVTQGNEFDFECLKAVIGSKAGYIGVISSKAKQVKFAKRLREAGIGEALFRRVHIPAGLDIGAQSPAEIAVSIASEVIALTNKDFLNTDKFKDKARRDA
jgi:xanthine dehydrogenase accessory factor